MARFFMLRLAAGDAVVARATANRSRHIVTQHVSAYFNAAISTKTANQPLGRANMVPRRAISDRTGHATQDPAASMLFLADTSISATHEELSYTA